MWKVLVGGCSVFVMAGGCKGCCEEAFASYRKTVACLWRTCGRDAWWGGRQTDASDVLPLRSLAKSAVQWLYLHGEAVRHHHDDQWDEEGHKGANQHEALLVEDTAAIDEDLVLIEETNHRDWHWHTLMGTEKGCDGINVFKARWRQRDVNHHCCSKALCCVHCKVLQLGHSDSFHFLSWFQWSYAYIVFLAKPLMQDTTLTFILHYHSPKNLMSFVGILTWL